MNKRNKTTSKKLSLTSETLRVLNHLDLQEVVGAISKLCTTNHSVSCVDCQST